MQCSRSRSLPHPWLYALPSGCLPQHVACAGRNYVLVETFKHDFFAATGLYQLAEDKEGRFVAGDPSDPVASAAFARQRAVLKLNRVGPFFGLPLRWIGRFLGRREIAVYRAVQDLPGVPAYLGPVGDTGFMHAYVPGHPLERYERVGDRFFDELMTLVQALHARDIAYVDLNKRQNILMGDDGRPYLIDFQISLRLAPAVPDSARGLSRIWPARIPGARWLLHRFQQGDIYHVLKHKRRLRPDLLTVEEQDAVERLSIWIRLHRAIGRPLTQLRRRILRHVAGNDGATVAGSHAK